MSTNNDSVIVKGILAVLAKKKLDSNLDGVSKSLQKITSERSKDKKAVVWSVVALNKVMLCRVKKVIKETSGKDVEVENKINTSLIGGLKIEYGDLMIDATLQNDFQKLQHLVS
ncbi:F0F1 ATP synthase subunit delta [Candidatus Gottesmanbacteria bacterium]|nr:F0F1 ATP synthase subunit delta [Candidatus Gottesmanbacteria bacterium]